MYALSIPISHEYIIYGASAVVAIMVIGFAVQIARGALSMRQLSLLLPIKGPVYSRDPASSAVLALLTAIAYPFYGAPMTFCHTQASYLKRPHTKALAHALVWWGFVAAAVSTVLGFIYDRWVNAYSFIPGGKLGAIGAYAVIGFGAVGGALIIVGFILMMIARWQGTRPIGEPAATDLFLWLIFLTSLSGFLLMGIELTAPNNYYAVATAFSLHIAFVTALFATMPWTKFGHAILQPIWIIYNKYRSLRGIEPRLLGPWSGELGEKYLVSHVSSRVRES